MARMPQELVNAEVLCCMSSLIYQLAKVCDFTDRQNAAGQELQSLCEQAFELAAPIDNWEEPLIESGWIKDGAWRGYNHDDYPNWLAAETNGECLSHATAQEACEANEIEPYQREVFEHWAVTDWLADKLEAKGEKVDKDFAGLCIWARTTTGQAIYADGIVEAITIEANAS